MEYIPYTYLVGWTHLNKWYYGVELGVKKIPCANPKNLWVTYFTSSKLVAYYRETHGDPNVIQIRKEFSVGSPEERMESAINWEKKVLSRIDITQDIWLNGRIGGDVCPATNKKISLLRYGIENVFQSNEIKEKIKSTNLKKYGVTHPSYSADLLEKKKQNNIKKYGVACTLNMPLIQEKATAGCRTQESKDKKIQTNLKKYGVPYVSQNQDIKNRVDQSRRALSERDIVKLIREYKRVFNVSLTCGWYQQSTDKLQTLLKDLQQSYGVFSFDEITKITVTKKYAESIKLLQSREVVKEIKKYKDLYGRNLKLGRGWDRKSEAELMQILQKLRAECGLL